ALEVTHGDGGDDLGDAAHLVGEPVGHEVHRVGEVLPGTGDAAHFSLTTELAFRTHFAGHARDFGCEAIELVHHRVDGVLQFEDFAAHVDGDLLRQVALGDGGRHFGDVADLAGEVRGHEIHIVSQVGPGSGDAGHLGLAAQFALIANLAGDARPLGREAVQLVHHDIDGVLELEDFAFHIDGDLLGEIAAGHGGRHFGDVAALASQIFGHRVHVVGEVLPGPGDAFDLGLAAELALGADFAGNTGHLRRERVQLVHHDVDGVLQLENFAFHIDCDFFRQIATGDGGGHFGNVAHLAGEVGRHGVDVVGQILPGAGNTLHVCLASQLPLGADFARDARHFRP